MKFSSEIIGVCKGLSGAVYGLLFTSDSIGLGFNGKISLFICYILIVGAGMITFVNIFISEEGRNPRDIYRYPSLMLVLSSTIILMFVALKFLNI